MDRNIIAIYNDSFGNVIPAELKYLMQGKHIRSDILYNKSILDLQIC